MQTNEGVKIVGSQGANILDKLGGTRLADFSNLKDVEEHDGEQ